MRLFRVKHFIQSTCPFLEQNRYYISVQLTPNVLHPNLLGYDSDDQDRARKIGIGLMAKNAAPFPVMHFPGYKPTRTPDSSLHAPERISAFSHTLTSLRSGNLIQSSFLPLPIIGGGGTHIGLQCLTKIRLPTILM